MANASADSLNSSIDGCDLDLEEHVDDNEDNCCDNCGDVDRSDVDIDEGGVDNEGFDDADDDDNEHSVGIDDSSMNREVDVLMDTGNDADAISLPTLSLIHI